MILNAARPEFAFERSKPLPGDSKELAGYENKPS
jgi:hypothetical protein